VELEDVLDDELSELCDVTDSVLCELVEALLVVEEEDVDDEDEEDGVDTDVDEVELLDELDRLLDEEEESDEVLDEDVSPAIVEDDEVELDSVELVDSSSNHNNESRPLVNPISGEIVSVCMRQTYWLAPITSVNVTKIGILSGSLIANSVAATAIPCEVMRSNGSVVLFQMAIVLDVVATGACPMPKVISVAIWFCAPHKQKKPASKDDRGTSSRGGLLGQTPFYPNSSRSPFILD